MGKGKLYKSGSEEPFRISRSKVDLYLNCPRCFYLDQKLGVKRPPGFPFNLNSAVDALLKKEFDHYREKQLPHPYMVRAGLNAVPFRHENLETWRYNFKGVSFLHAPTNLETYGAVDDLWVDLTNGQVIVVDYKATSKAEAVSLNADWQIGYKRQMEFYQWLLRCNGLNVADQGWFVYCNGRKDRSRFDQKLEFEVSMLPYTGDTSWIEPALHSIKSLLDSSGVPSASAECEYCDYVRRAQAALKNELQN